MILTSPWRSTTAAGPHFISSSLCLGVDAVAVAVVPVVVQVCTGIALEANGNTYMN